MDRLRERLSVAERALASFVQVLHLPNPGIVERDAAIKRFEYSIEATWKAAQQYLRVVEGNDVASPKSAIRVSRDAGLLSDEQATKALALVDDRNLTTHTYNEDLATALFARLPDHATLLQAWRKAMQDRLAAAGS